MPQGEIDGDARRRFRAAMKRIEVGDFASAIPLLETMDFPLAPTLLAYARLRASGAEIAEFVHQGETFRFRMHPAYVGIDAFHAAGSFYEAEELGYCRARVLAGGVVVDIGAHSGNHTIYFGRFLRPRLLIPVEPMEVSVDLLRVNARLNDVAIDERGLGLAASDEPGLLEMSFGSVMAMAKVGPGAVNTRTVRAIKLDDLVPETVDFLKVDVEGFEMNVLKGAARILDRDRPQILIETANETEQGVRAFLEGCNYVRAMEVRYNDWVNTFFRPRPGFASERAR